MKFVEFIGLPNAGKYSLIRGLIRQMAERGVRGKSIQEDRSEPGGLINRTDFYSRELIIFLSTLKQILVDQDSSIADLVLVHRGPFDAMFWFSALGESGLISKEKAIIGAGQARVNTDNINLVVLVRVPVEVSLKRRGDMTLGQKDLTKDGGFLRCLYDAYEGAMDTIPEEKFLVVDGTVSKEKTKDNLRIILQRVLKLLESPLMGSLGDRCSVAQKN